MFKAIGFVITLYAISQIMQPTFAAFQNAAVASFGTVQVAAEVSQTQLQHYTSTTNRH